MNLYSLHIGLNQVETTHYNNWDGHLKHAEADAFAMYQIASNQGFKDSLILLTKNATRKKILVAINKLAKKAKAGDVVWISYSGHGSFIPDMNGDEDNNLDETWCCYDGMLIDDELLHCWSQFRAGVRIVLVSDSCHSGDIAKAEDDPAWVAQQKGAKFLPIEKSLPIYKANQAFYDKILADLPPIDPKNLVVRVKQFGGCNENSFSYEGDGNGAFTIAIKTAWQNGAFEGDYAMFFQAIQQHIDLNMQQPVYLNIGAKDDAFDALQPFSAEKKEGQTLIVDTPKREDTEGVQLLVDFGTASKANLQDMQTHQQETIYAVGQKEIVVFTPKSKSANNAWDEAHALYDDFKAKGVNVRFIEPDSHHPTTSLEILSQSKAAVVAETFLSTWPHPKTTIYDPLWHLSADYSQLAEARDSLMNDADFMVKQAKKPIRIAHIDTGYFPYKDFMPEKLLTGLCKSFVEGEEQNLAFDYVKGGLLPETQGHGAATLAILAGPKVNAPNGLKDFSGYVGAIPFAEVISIRIQDCVALVKTRAFEQAVYYAIEQGCEVITMSKAGAPSRRWADAVNFAYENGVTIVSATGNSWRKGFAKYLPKSVLFPARFERVIGAAGVTYSKQPYVFDANDWENGAKMAGGVDMQGNFGPDEQMHHVMSAYTPNLLWAETDQKNKPSKPYYEMTGGGTSSATPQIAAAAAMWIARHRAELEYKGYNGTWRQVEAVRKALFETTAPDSHQYFTYMGRGSLQTVNALNYAPADAADLTKSAEAETPFLPLIRTLFSLLGAKSGNGERSMDDVKTEMFALEMAQFVISEPALEAFSTIDFQNPNALAAFSASELAAFKVNIQNSPNVSETLKRALANT